MNCRLCTLDRGLRNSHIIPESLYKPLYDKKHRAVHLTDFKGTNDYKKLKPLQKGLREKLLCNECPEFK